MAKKVVAKTPVAKTARTRQTQVRVLDRLKAASLKTDLPDFRSGDRVVVNCKIKEGDKERIQAYEGIVIAINGNGIRKAFTVRKISAGVGVERVFPLHSPMIASIEVKVEGFVRRGKLYYLRDRDGRAARIQDKNLKLSTAQGLEAVAVARKTAPTQA